VPSHFSERIGLFVIIALGETIAAAEVTASDLEMNATRIAAVVVSFGIAVAFWWLYFDYHAEGAARELESREAERGRLGRALSYLHVPIVAGIIVAAVAAEPVIAHPGEKLHGNDLLPLAAGPGLFLAAAWSSRPASCTPSGASASLPSWRFSGSPSAERSSRHWRPGHSCWSCPVRWRSTRR
jgi:low temperature requirement protein LtrA